MEVVPGDPVEPVIWDEYHKIVEKHGGKASDFEHVERFAFYERAKKPMLLLLQVKPPYMPILY